MGDKRLLLHPVVDDPGQVAAPDLAHRAGVEIGDGKEHRFSWSRRKKRQTCGTKISSPISRKKFSIPLMNRPSCGR